jgi:hypothetical protein
LLLTAAPSAADAPSQGFDVRLSKGPELDTSPVTFQAAGCCIPPDCSRIDPQTFRGDMDKQHPLADAIIVCLNHRILPRLGRVLTDVR